MKRRTLLICIAVCLFYLLVAPVFAHPGRTDSNGGHTNHSTGEYHYHHGYSEHDHYDMDGDGDIDCPYDFDDKTDHSAKESATVNPKTSQKMQTTSPTEEPTTPANSETQPTGKKPIKKVIGNIVGAVVILLFWAYGALIVTMLLCNLILNIIDFGERAGIIFYYVLFIAVFIAGAVLIISKLFH